MGTLQVWSASSQLDVCDRSLCQLWEKGLQSTGTACAGPGLVSPECSPDGIPSGVNVH